MLMAEVVGDRVALWHAARHCSRATPDEARAWKSATADKGRGEAVKGRRGALAVGANYRLGGFLTEVVAR